MFQIVYTCTADQRLCQGKSTATREEEILSKTLLVNFSNYLQRSLCSHGDPQRDFRHRNPSLPHLPTSQPPPPPIPTICMSSCRSHWHPSIRPWEHANVPRDTCSLHSKRNIVHYDFSTDPSGHRVLHWNLVADHPVVFFFSFFFPYECTINTISILWLKTGGNLPVELQQCTSCAHTTSSHDVY